LAEEGATFPDYFFFRAKGIQIENGQEAVAVMLAVLASQSAAPQRRPALPKH